MIIAAYFIFRNKNSSNDTVSYDGFFAKNTDTKANQDTTTNSTNTGSEATTISIKNALLSASPLIGQLHLTAQIELTNQPQTGSLVVLLGNNNITEVTLPLSGTTYYLDEYVPASSGSTYNLTAKIGSITKTVQITI